MMESEAMESEAKAGGGSHRNVDPAICLRSGRVTMTMKLASVGFVSVLLTVWGAAAASEPPDHSDELAAPFAVEAAKYISKADSSPEQPLQSNVYPWFGDFDGNGKPDLLVGDSGSRLRIYHNLGSPTAPKFDVPVWFQDLCPTGVLPWG
jgi:hypothetical protein